VEKPNVRVTWQAKSHRRIAPLESGYLDPAASIPRMADREDENILFVPKAGEILYRLKV